MIDDYLSLMDEELEDDFENKYPVHQSANTMSSKDTDDSGGRPQKKEQELKPSGQATRNLGSNKQVKPSTK